MNDNNRPAYKRIRFVRRAWLVAGCAVIVIVSVAALYLLTS